MTSQINIGSQQAFTMTFKDYLAVLSDPTTIQLDIVDPNGDLTTILNGSMTKVSTGVWYALYTPALFGRHYYKITTTGVPALAQRGSFDTAIDDPL